MMLDAKHVKEKLELSGLTQEEFANKLSTSDRPVTQQVVSNWFKRDSIPPKYWETIRNILALKTSEAVEYTNEDKGRVLTIRSIAPKAGAGTGADIDCIDEIEYDPPIAIYRDGLDYTNVDNLEAISIMGTSMLPTIMPNEKVIIDRGINKYVGDDLYVLNFAGSLMLKRIQFDPITNSFDIISDNPQYTNYKLNLNEDQSHFHIIGKVVTTIRR